MDNFNFLALAHWRKIVQIDIYYYFQSFFNEAFENGSHSGKRIGVIPKYD
jgi:hypothetical protein